MQRDDGYALLTHAAFKSCSLTHMHLCSCTPYVAPKRERPSMCAWQPTCGADPGTSFFPLSPLLSLPFLLIIGWRTLLCLVEHKAVSQ